MQTTMESVAAQLRARIGAVRDPATGEFPTIVVSGNSPDDLQVFVEGSARVREQVSAPLELEPPIEEEFDMPPSPKLPRVFLSYATEDHDLAEHIARSLRTAGIETWWDRWEIRAGDSIRRKVDEGLGNCTHFLVLLTPASIHKPWVKEEIDAGFMLKVRKQACMIALRHDLDAVQLPPLLGGSASPTLGTPPDLTQLISDIHGITRKPVLGTPPRAVAERAKADPGYSAAANAVARVFVESSTSARKFDPCLSRDELVEKSGLSEDDVTDALYELSSFVRAEKNRPVIPQLELFVKFDPLWKEWDPVKDALELASGMLNDPAFPTDPGQIDTRMGWGPRRLNPAMAFLVTRKIVRFLESHDGGQYAFHHLSKIDETRRFVKSRSE